MKLLLKFITVALFVVMVAGTAQAIPLNGEVAMGGISLTGFDWMNNDVLPELNGFIGGDGDFSGLTGTVAFASFDFVNPNDPVAAPLWSTGGFTFVLETVQIQTRTDIFLNLVGTGTMSAAGFDDTFGAWALSLNRVGDSLFSFGSTTAVADPVPEPATMLLLGSGLVGLAGLGRKKFKK